MLYVCKRLLPTWTSFWRSAATSSKSQQEGKLPAETREWPRSWVWGQTGSTEHSAASSQWNWPVSAKTEKDSIIHFASHISFLPSRWEPMIKKGVTTQLSMWGWRQYGTQSSKFSKQMASLGKDRKGQYSTFHFSHFLFATDVRIHDQREWPCSWVWGESM